MARSSNIYEKEANNEKNKSKSTQDSVAKTVNNIQNDKQNQNNNSSKTNKLIKKETIKTNNNNIKNDPTAFLSFLAATNIYDTDVNRNTEGVLTKSAIVKESKKNRVDSTVSSSTGNKN